MGIEASDLKRLSSLLDTALDLAPEAREAWLDTLPADTQALAPVLRNLLARHAAGDTLDFIDRPPAFDPPRDDASADRAFAAGAMVGPYRLLRELGAGGMGEVWLAERADGTLKRQVALKLPTLGVRRAILVQRFERERDILAGLEHPHIARLYDAGFADDGQPYLALEFVEGRPIDAWCREQALPIAERVKLLLQVAEAVAYAHSRLVLHRDLKPGNILVTADGQVRLLDFGIAKLIEGESAASTELTRVSGRALTPLYASPEQIRGEPLTTASDVYSLGAVAYEALADRPPLGEGRPGIMELQRQVLEVDPPLASATTGDPAHARALRGDLDAILAQALRKEPSWRYATASALAQDLRQFLDGGAVSARRETAFGRALRLAQRHRAVVAAGAGTLLAFGLAIGLGATALVVAVLAAGLGAALWQARAAKRDRDRALRLAERNEAVAAFLNTLITDAARGGRALTAEQLLERSEALIAPELEGDAEAHASVLSMIAMSMQTLGNLAEAVRLSDRALALARDTDDANLKDQLVINRALAIGWAGDYAQARAGIERVLARRGLAPEQRTEAHHYLAMLANSNNDHDAGLVHAEAALRSLRAQHRPSRRMEASLLSSLGAACSLHGRMAEADAHFAAAHERMQALGQGSSAHAVTLLNNWSVINERAGDARRAQELAERALALAGPNGRSPFLLFNRARALEYQGRLEEAAAGYGEAAAVAEATATLPALVGARLGVASVRLAQGHVDEARDALRAADVKAFALPASHPQRILRLVIAGRLASSEGRPDEAQEAFRSAIEAAPQQMTAVMARLGLAEIALQRGAPQEALELARAAHEQAAQLQGGKAHSFRTALAAVTCARALQAAGDEDASRAMAREALALLAASVDPDHPAVRVATGLAQTPPPDQT